MLDFASIHKAVRGRSHLGSRAAIWLMPAVISCWRPEVVIEIGIGYGYTTTIIAETLCQVFEAPTLYSVDIRQEPCDAAMRTIWEAHPRLRGRAIHADSHAFDFRALLGDTRAKLITIDGDLSCEGLTADINATWPVFDRDGLYIIREYTRNQERAYEAIEDVLRPRLDVLAWPNPGHTAYALATRRLGPRYEAPQ